MSLTSSDLNAPEDSIPNQDVTVESSGQTGSSPNPTTQVSNPDTFQSNQSKLGTGLDHYKLTGKENRFIQSGLQALVEGSPSDFTQPAKSYEDLLQRGIVDKDGKLTSKAELSNGMIQAGMLNDDLSLTPKGKIFLTPQDAYFDSGASDVLRSNNDYINDPDAPDRLNKIKAWGEAKAIGLFSTDEQDAANKPMAADMATVTDIAKRAGDVIYGGSKMVTDHVKGLFTNPLMTLRAIAEGGETGAGQGFMDMNVMAQSALQSSLTRLGMQTPDQEDMNNLTAEYQAAAYKNFKKKTDVTAAIAEAAGNASVREQLDAIQADPVANEYYQSTKELYGMVANPANLVVGGVTGAISRAAQYGTGIIDIAVNLKRIEQLNKSKDLAAAAILAETQATNHAFNHVAAAGDAAESLAAQTTSAAEAQQLHATANGYGRIDSALSREFRASANAAASEAANHGAMAAESTAKATGSSQLAEAAANEAKQLQAQSLSLENSLPPTVQSQVARLGNVPVAYAAKTAGIASNSVGYTLGALDTGYSALGPLRKALAVVGLYTHPAIALVVESTLASKNLWKGASRLLDSIGENMLKEQGTIPFWRNVAADMSTPVGKTFAGYMDNALPPIYAGAKKLASGVAGVAVPSLMYEAINNDGVDSNVLKQAAADSLVFGGAHGAFKGAKIGDQAEFVATRTADRLIFNDNLKKSGDAGQFDLYDRGVQPSTKDMLASYSGAYPNTKFTFTESGPSFAHGNNITLNVNNPRSFADAIAGHEIAHVLQNEHQIQPQIVSAMLGDIHLEQPTRLGELNRNGGKLDPEFVKFSTEYNNRLAAINKPPIGVKDLAVEFFTDKAAEVLKSDISTGELTKRAKESRLSRNIKSRFSAYFGETPIIKQLHIKTGGAIDNAGRLVMGSGLLNDGFTQSAGVQSMVRKMYRESAGLARNNTKEVKFNKTRGNKEDSKAGDNNPPVKSEDGYTMSQPKGSQSERPGVTNGLKAINEYNALQKKSGITTPENNLDPSAKKMTGIPDAGQSAAIVKSGAIHPNMIGDFATLVGLMDSRSGGTTVLHYTPLEQGRTIQNSLGETFHHFKPIGVQVTKTGRVLIAGLDIALWNDNIKRIASTRTAKNLGYSESELRVDAHAASNLHADLKSTDAYFEKKYGNKASEHKDLANATYGLLTGAQGLVNTSLASIGIEKVHGVYRTFSLDNILHVTNHTAVDLRLSPNSYYSIKANLMPEAPVIDKFGNNIPLPLLQNQNK